MRNIGIYICLGLMILFGMMLFDYAFPELSVQRGAAAILSIYCFSSASIVWFMLELKKDEEDKK